jgi:FkbM family methyltransferase
VTPTVHRLVDPFLPEAAIRLWRYKRRLEALGQPGRWALSRAVRQALETTRAELFPRQVLKDADLVVDVGANVGAWSRGIARLLRPRRILAFEPQADCVARLRALADEIPGFRCVEAAVGAEGGWVELHEQSASALSSVRPLGADGLRFHPGSRTLRQVRVPLVALDDALRDEAAIDILKLDVQATRTRSCAARGRP